MIDQPAIILYTRPGCHLCEDASAVLLPLAQQHGLDIQTVNIMEDATAHDRWWAEIPVIVIGKSVLTAPIDHTALRRAVEQAGSQRG